MGAAPPTFRLRPPCKTPPPPLPPLLSVWTVLLSFLKCAPNAYKSFLQCIACSRIFQGLQVFCNALCAQGLQVFLQSIVCPRLPRLTSLLQCIARPRLPRLTRLPQCITAQILQVFHNALYWLVYFNTLWQASKDASLAKFMLIHSGSNDVFRLCIVASIWYFTLIPCGKSLRVRHLGRNDSSLFVYFSVVPPDGVTTQCRMTTWRFWWGLESFVVRKLDLGNVGCISS